MDPSERKTWQENTGLLYECLNAHACEWPSLSVEWLHTYQEPEGEYGRFLLGTCADSPRENYVYVTDVLLPPPTGVLMEDRVFAKRCDRAGFAYNGDKPVYRMRKRIHIPLGEIGKARISPIGYSSLGACVCGSGEGVLFDCTVKPDEFTDLSKPLMEGDGGDAVVARLYGHVSAAWGLSWSWYDQGQLVTSSDDNRICTWNIEKAQFNANKTRPAWGRSKTLTPSQSYCTGHTQAIQCVASSVEHPAMFMSAGDDGRILVWDSRISDHEHAYFPVVKDPGEAFNCISQSKFRTHLLATAGTGPDICIWDIRHCGYPLARLNHQEKGMQNRWMSNCVTFNRHRDYLLSSAGSDGKVIVWDLREIGKEQSIENAQDGPPELMFIHPGHGAPVQDVSWCPTEARDLYLTSVSDNNEWHVWAYDQAIFDKVESDEASDEDYDNSFPVE